MAKWAIDKQMRVIEEQASVLIFDPQEDAALIPLFNTNPFTNADSSPEIAIEEEIHALKDEEQTAAPKRIQDYLGTVVPAMLLVLTNFYFAAQGRTVNAELIYWLQILLTAGAAYVGYKRKSSLTVLIWLGAFMSMLVAPLVPAFFNNGFQATWMNYLAGALLMPTTAMFGRTLWRNRSDFFKVGAGLLPITTMLTSVLTASTILSNGLLQRGGQATEYLILDVCNTLLSYGLIFLGRKRGTRWAGLATAVIYNVAFYASMTTTPLSAEMLPVWFAWLTPVGLGYLLDRWWQRRKRVVTL